MNAKFLLRLLAFVPILVAVAVVNYHADPAHIFQSGDYESGIASALLSGQGVANLTNWDERLLAESYIAGMSQRQDVVLIGSSRAMEIGADFPPSKKFFNHSVSGATLEDMTAIYGLYVERGLLPRKLILALDPWMFQEDNGELRWQALGEAYNRARARIGLLAVSYSTSRKYWQLLSPSYFQISIEFLWNKIRSNERITDDYSVTSETQGPSIIKRPDGSFWQGEAYQARSVADAHARAVKFVDGLSQTKRGNFTKLDAKLQQLFQNLTQDALVSGVEINFLLVPYHPYVFQHFSDTQGLDRYSEVELYVRQLAQKLDIPVLGSYDPRQYDLGDKDFFDGLHPRLSALRNIFDTSGR